MRVASSQAHDRLVLSTPRLSGLLWAHSICTLACTAQGPTEIHFKPRASTSRITTRESPHNQNYDQGGSPQAELRPGSWLAGWLAGWGDYIRPGNLSYAWLAGWLAGGLAGWLAEAQRGSGRPRDVQRKGAWIEQACHALGWRLPTSRFTTREAPHRYLYICVEPERMPPRTTTTYVHMVPNRNPCQTQGLPQAELRPGRFPTRRITTRLSTSRITTREPTYYPQAELRPGSLLAGWLAGWGDCDQETCHALGWLAGWLGGWLAGWLRPREAQRCPEMQSVDRTSLSCGNPEGGWLGNCRYD